VVSYYKLTGNAYLYLNRASAESPPDELWIVPTHLIKPQPDDHSFLKGYLFDAHLGQPVPLETWQICHIKTYNPFSPFVGLSLLESLSIISQEDIARQRYSANLYAKDNAKIPGALAFADRIPDTEWERLKEESKEAGRQPGRLMMIRDRAVGCNGWRCRSLIADAISEARRLRRNLVESLRSASAGVNATEAKPSKAFTGCAAARCSRDAQLFALTSCRPGISCSEDVRLSNRLMDLQEQQEYTKTHTVDGSVRNITAMTLGGRRGVITPADCMRQCISAPTPAAPLIRRRQRRKYESPWSTGF
jgi:hypothetical protein